jgi:hypothetical protein
MRTPASTIKSDTPAIGVSCVVVRKATFIRNKRIFMAIIPWRSHGVEKKIDHWRGGLASNSLIFGIGSIARSTISGRNRGCRGAFSH